MKKIHVGTIDADPSILTHNRGHDYGVGRTTSTHKDKRHKRKTTRRDRVKESLKGW